MKKNVLKVILVALTVMIAFFALNISVNAEEIDSEETTDEVVDDTNQDAIDEPVDEEIVEDETVEDDTVLEDTTEDEVEEPVDESTEEVSFVEMLKDLIEEWLPAILAVLGGGTGAGAVIAIAFKIFRKLAEEARKSAEANKESNATLSEAKNVVANGLDAIANALEDFKNNYSGKFDSSMEKMNECIGEIDSLKTQNEQFKKLIALLVASNPELSSNGYATMILELLNERSEQND